MRVNVSLGVHTHTHTLIYTGLHSCLELHMQGDELTGSTATHATFKDRQGRGKTPFIYKFWVQVGKVKNQDSLQQPQPVSVSQTLTELCDVSVGKNLSMVTRLCCRSLY